MRDDFFKDYENDRDNLTFLYRRNVITEYMLHLIGEGTPFSFIMLDIDNFKLINDTYGHLTGDEVLREVGESLRKCCNNKGVVGRYGGDEFVFVLPNIVEYQEVWQFSFDVLKSAQTLEFSDETIMVSYTMGIARFPKDSISIDELITTADKALYRGKVKGRNCFIIYLPEKHANIELQALRDKVYDPMNLHARVYTMLTLNDHVEQNIMKVINFLGPYLMIDHLCIETDGALKYEYHHPLAPKREYHAYGEKVIEGMMANYGTIVERTVQNSKLVTSPGLIMEMDKQGVTAGVICKIKAFEKSYGYLRAEMTALDTGRIWQTNDLILLEDFACVLALVLYVRELKNK